MYTMCKTYGIQTTRGVAWVVGTVKTICNNG